MTVPITGRVWNVDRSPTTVVLLLISNYVREMHDHVNLDAEREHEPSTRET